jgi:hypothetical protein
VTRALAKTGGRLRLGLAVAMGAAAVTAQASDQVPDQVSTTAIAAVLADIDGCVLRSDTTSLLRLFEPDNPGAHAMVKLRIEQLAAASIERCESAVSQPPRVVGPRTVVRVRQEITVLPRGEKAGGKPCAITLDWMLAVRATPGGAAVPTFLAEIPRRFACVRDDLFKCPACNYQIGGVAGWLCVPMCSDRSQSIEAATFYLIGTDLACDVSVRVDPDEPVATVVARQLGDTVLALDADSRSGIAAAWLPCAHEDAPPKGFAGARLEIELPRDFGGQGGLAVFHVLTFGGLQHLLLVRGSAHSVRANRRAIDELLATYRLLQTDLDGAAAAARSLHHHTGSRLAGRHYHNDQFGLHFDGPPEWTAQLRCGGSAFRVAWSDGQGARLWLTGYAVPPGVEHWCERTADRWLRQICVDADLEETSSTPWHKLEEGGAATRSVVCRPRTPAGPGTPQLRLLHARLEGDLLVVADGQAPTADGQAAIEEAFASLRRD